MPVEVGQVLEGKVTGITNFGAFVDLADGVTGLVHISEVADTFVKDVNDYLKMNQKVKVKVIRVADDGKISLSIRKLKDNKNQRKKKAPEMSFEQKLAKFMKDSEERLSDLRKNHEAKRGGSSGYGRRGVL